MQAYKQLEQLSQKLHNLSHFLYLGKWDSETMMPSKGSAARGAAIGELHGLIAELITAPSTKTLLDEAERAKTELTKTQQANLREFRRMYSAQAALPNDFSMLKARLSATVPLIWAECRKNNDFATFVPTLKEVITVARKEAQYRSAATGKPLYEALFNQYECGMTLETVDSIFSDVKSWLPELLQKILTLQKAEGLEARAPEAPFPKDKQDALGRHLMKVWGFDFESGRLDVSAHPFTGMVKEDSRITTNYDLEDFTKALFATIHETGHSKYETNCGPMDMRGQPVCNARSLMIHESQSRFAEVVIGRSSAFPEFLAPLLKEHLGEQPAFSLENVRLMSQRVRPGFIRIFADEVCYPLHVLLRYEIERALIEGTMEVEDIPRVWNEKMKAYLGLETEGRDDIGCLQDTHWAMGAFGYFPTYTLGTMFAVQLMYTIKKELGESTVDKCIRTGQMEPIFAKQKEKIWDQGCLYETEELMIKATGETLNPKYFREYLERRYLRHED
ncbi:Carboxypeptidase Taq (M32) metallopeptidase, putative [Leishmania lindenbergi]|uniref:carboxypeptidase Taq n=1 Tax=Leishmania lindenbergi TaxID=651832 RepID=A0AAW3AQL1_9TRYP